MTDILIIGAGNMGCAIGKGLLQSPNNHVYFKTLEGIETDMSDFKAEISRNQVFFNDHYDAFEKLNNPWIILAVKPHLVKPVIDETADLLQKITPTALVSVAAGIDIKTIKSACSTDIPIVRAMPNTPVATGNGLMGFYSEHEATNKAFEALCQPLGLVPQLENEDAFHLFTALAGSGPAYIFHLVEALSEAAYQHGMDKTQAGQVALQTFLGSATLLHHDNATSLRKKVTSPNGTTQAGLEQLMNDDLDPSKSHLTQLMFKTLDAAKKRSQNMN